MQTKTLTATLSFVLSVLKMSSTPVGYLYTPQQLAGSLSYGSGVRLGNWREDDEVAKMRMMNYIQKKESMDLVLLKKQAVLGPQLAPAILSAPPADSMLKFGDKVMIKSEMNNGCLSVSMGQKLISDLGELYTVTGSASTEPRTRNAIEIVSLEGVPDDQPVCYGMKIALKFSSALGVQGYLGSARAAGVPTATQLIGKQECYMRVVEPGAQVPYECAWTILPQHVDDRIATNGTPVDATVPLLFSHCFTNRRLSCVNIGMPTDFGMECGVCAHTYVETRKVNKLMRETLGRPTNGLISKTETTECLWTLVFHEY